MACCEKLEEVVYKGRDNPIRLRLSVDKTPIKHDQILRCQLQMGTALSFDSATKPDYFDWSHADYLQLNLANTTLATGRYAGQLTIYDADHIQGRVWGELVIVIKAG